MSLLIPRVVMMVANVFAADAIVLWMIRCVVTCVEFSAMHAVRILVRTVFLYRMDHGVFSKALA